MLLCLIKLRLFLHQFNTFGSLFSQELVALFPLQSLSFSQLTPVFFHHRFTVLNGKGLFSIAFSVLIEDVYAIGQLVFLSGR